MGLDAIHALWVDPLAFEPAEHGAPYLPESRRTASAVDDGVLPALLERMPQDCHAGELGALVAVLRAAAIVHQSHHWQSTGNNQYGDHLLFDRLYQESLGPIDQVAERAVGTGGVGLVDAQLQASLLPGLVGYWLGPQFPTEPVTRSLEIERCVLDCLAIARSALREQEILTSGTDNLLQGVADKHEEFVYLLQQRQGAPVVYSYDSR